MSMNFSPEKPEQAKPTIKEALEAAKVEGARMEQAGVSKTREFFAKAWGSAKKIGSTVNTGVKVGLGMTKPESRKVLSEAIEAEINKAGDAAGDKLFSIGEDFEIRRMQVIDTAKNKWKSFDQEHLVPLNNNLEQVINIVATTVRELPGYAAEQAEKKAKQYTAMAREWVRDATVGQINQINQTIAEVADFLKKQEEEKLAAKAERKAGKLEIKVYKQRERLEIMNNKIEKLRVAAVEHHEIAERTDGGFNGASTKLRVAALEQSAAAAG